MADQPKQEKPVEPKPKALIIEPVPQSTLVKIRWRGGGEVPAVLDGTYTSAILAKRAVNTWLAQEDQQGRQVEVLVAREEEEREKQSRKQPSQMTSV